MDLNEYIASLEAAHDSTSFLEMDREKEIAYMNSHRFVFRQVLSRIPTYDKPLRILDIGPTPFTIFLKKNYAQHEVWALDRTALLKERFESHGIILRTCDLDSEVPPFDVGCFDLIVFTEVLEHVFAPPSDVLRGIRYILRDGGTLLLGVPNIAALNKRIKFAFGKSPLPNADAQMKKDWVHGHGHLHEYTMHEIVSLIQGCGFDIVSRKFLRPSSADVRRRSSVPLASRLIRSVYRAVQWLSPSFGTQIFVECRKPGAR